MCASLTVAEPIVSVVVPVYGRSKQLDQAVQSLLNQTGLPENAIEIIVVDDGSPTPPTFAPGLPVNVVRRHQNGGAAAARNEGIKAASGQLIAFLDSDDVWLPGKLAAQLALFEDLSKDYDPNLLAVGCAFFDPDRKTGKLRARFPLETAELHLFASGCWFGPGSTILLSRSAFERVGQQDENLRRLEDLDWFIRFGQAGGKFVSTKTADVLIRPSGGAKLGAVLQSVRYLTDKYGPTGSSALPQNAWNRLAAYLALEKAVAYFGDNKKVAGVREVLVSFFRKPRVQPALEKFWEHNTDVPPEVKTAYHRMINADKDPD